MQSDDTQLQERFLAGDMSAYEALFHRYYPPLTGYAFKFVRDMDTARDLVQDLFVRIYQNRESIEIRFSFKAYCYQGVRNSCLKHLERHKTHERHHSEIAAVSDQSVDRDVLVESEDEYRIYQAIETLPDQCKKIFWMNRMDGKKNGEIAEELGISKRTVETQISKALKILREKLLSWVILLLLLGGIPNPCTGNSKHKENPRVGAYRHTPDHKDFPPQLADHKDPIPIGFPPQLADNKDPIPIGFPAKSPAAADLKPNHKDPITRIFHRNWPITKILLLLGGIPNPCTGNSKHRENPRVGAYRHTPDHKDFPPQLADHKDPIPIGFHRNFSKLPPIQAPQFDRKKIFQKKSPTAYVFLPACGSSIR